VSPVLGHDRRGIGGGGSGCLGGFRRLGGRGAGGCPAEAHPAQVGPPAELRPVPLPELSGGRWWGAVERLGDVHELRHLQRRVVSTAEHPQQDPVRGERPDATHREQRRPGLVVGRRAQPLLVERGDPVQHLAEPGRPLLVATEPDQLGLRAREQRRERGERDVVPAVQLGTRPQLGGDPALACRGEPLGAALGQGEVGGALGQRREPHLVQPLGRGQDGCHRRVGTGHRQEGGQVVVEAEPSTNRPLDPGHLGGVEGTPRVHNQGDPRRTDLDHNGLVRGGAGAQQRLADPVAGDDLVAGARGEPGEGAQ
jgi:hypothetical protein